MARDLSFFMRDNKDEIIKVPAPESFGDNGKDEKGEPIMLEIRVLSRKRIHEINEKYKDTKIAKDPKTGEVLINNGEVVHDVVRDNVKAGLQLFVEALAFPNLKDEKLMAHYGVYEHIYMPWAVFPNPKDFSYVNDQILIAAGLKESSTDLLVEEAKN